MTTLTKQSLPNHYLRTVGLNPNVLAAGSEKLQNWQAIVSLFEFPNENESIHNDGVTYVRFDQPHLSIPAPWLQTQWQYHVGWFQAPNSDTHLPPPHSSPTASERLDVGPARLNQLLAEAAHDIRSPIAVAQQIITSVTKRANTTGRWTKAETDLLAEASMRLSQATHWADGILIDERLLHGEPVNVRRRFYPHQWRAEIEPLLRTIASQRQVKLDWVGWDRSLPRLYLDSNHLSRAVLNLLNNAVQASHPGDRIRVEVAWQTNVTQRMIISIEDEGGGLETTLMRKINSTSLWPQEADEPRQPGFGLKTAKALIRAIGGTIAVQKSTDRGTLFRLSIPVDNYHSLVRSWLLQNAELSANAPSPKQITIHALRCATGAMPNRTQLPSGQPQLTQPPAPHSAKTSLSLTPALTTLLSRFDAQLQRSASVNDLVYRVAADRWLWISLQKQSFIRSTGKPPALVSVLRNARANLQNSDGNVECLDQMVFQLNDLSLAELQAGSEVRYRLPNVTGLVAEKIAELMGSHVPPVDQLELSESAITVRPKRDHIQIRSDRADSSFAPSKRPIDAYTSLAETPSDSFSGALAELSQAWHASQKQLQNLGPRLSPPRPKSTPMAASH